VASPTGWTGSVVPVPDEQPDPQTVDPTVVESDGSQIESSQIVSSEVVSSEEPDVAPEAVEIGALDPADVVDELPDDLQPALADQDEYLFPNNNRRRIPGYLYLLAALALVVLYLVRGEGVLVNRGLLGAAALLGVIGLYSVVSGWNLDVDERDALVAASRDVGFPIGHASAQMGWRGLLSRPTWRILLYSADDPPTKRGLVLVDGVDGSVVEKYVEDNPEDWSDIDL
jgi:hypothetical protein